MITIVVVNWNSGLFLRGCIKSIMKHHSCLVSKLVVVDNASTDQSINCLRDLTPTAFEVVQIINDFNRGFSVACNQGAMHASSDFILFLNPDTELFHDSLTSVMIFIQDANNAKVGICGIQLIDEHGRISRSCAHLPTLGRLVAQSLGFNRIWGFRSTGITMHEWDHADTRTVEQVIGAFFFTRRTVFETLGGFDERFFVYFEEVDYSFRARSAGWSSVYLAATHAFHAGGGTSRQVKAARLFYSLRSRLLYGFKHFTFFQAWTLALVTILLEPVIRSLFCVLRGSLTDLRHTWQAYGMLIEELPRILRRHSPP